VARFVRAEVSKAFTRWAEFVTNCKEMGAKMEAAARRWQLAIAGGALRQWQGLTLVHISAQLEPFLTQNRPYIPPNPP